MQPGDRIAGRFDLEALAAAGGMGSVYRAKDRSSGRLVAVKCLHADSTATDRFLREALVLADLRHPAIVEYIAHGKSESGEPYMAMEWLEGEDLSFRIARGRLGAAEVIALGRSAAEALAAAHAQGIVHRDVKPSNLFLQHGRIESLKVLDFGLARHVRSSTSLTRTGMILGTPGYLSPEQARSDAELDARSDVFSLGVVLYECLAGKGPFDAEDVMGTLAKLLLADPPRLSDLGIDLPAPLDDLIFAMLSKDRERRPRDAGAVALALAEVDDAVPTPRRQMAPVSALTRGEQRLLSVLFVGAPPDGEDPARVRSALEKVVGAHGGSMELLADGSAVVLLSGAGAATDQAARAAECGLSIHAALPFAPVVLATGRGVVSPRNAAQTGSGARPSPPVIGEVIDRAGRRMRAELRRASKGSTSIAVDEVTAGLLDARFDLGGDGGGLYVAPKQDFGGRRRTLLGQPTPFVGREREVSSLLEMIDECMREPVARAALVTGPAGAGKSRLGIEIARMAADKGMSVWIGRGDLWSPHSPFGIVARALCFTAQIFDGEAPAVRAQKLRARVGRHLPSARVAAVAELLGEIAGAPFPDEGRPELLAVRQSPVLLPDLVRRSFEELAHAESSARPLLLLIEDLQWGDLPSVKLLDDALRNLRNKPFAIIALARPEVHELWPRLFAEREVQEIRLGELTKSGAKKLVRAALGEAFEASLVDAIVERSGGNAFFLEELIRAVRDGRGTASLPDTIIAMVHARLEAVPAEGRRVLRAASVFGDVFPKSGLLALLGGSAAEVSASLDDLVQRELLARRGHGKYAGDEELAFRSELVREAAYAMLTDEDRTRGHRRAAEWLEAAGEPQPLVIAEHYERSGEPARAIDFYRRAAISALSGGDYAIVREHVKRGQSLGAAGETLGALELAAAEAHVWRGENAEAEVMGSDAMDLLPRGSAPWFLAAAMAGIGSGRLGAMDRMTRIVSAITAEMPLEYEVEGEVPAAVGASVIAAARLVVLLVLSGARDLADPLFARIWTRVRSGAIREHPIALGFAHRAFAVRSKFEGDQLAALRGLEASGGHFERAGALRDACGDRINHGYLLLELGANERAEGVLRDGLERAERLGLVAQAADARQNLGMALMRRGALREAITSESLALEAYLSQGVQRMVAAARVYLARVFFMAQSFRDSERQARFAIEVASQMAPMRAYAHGVLAQVLVAQKRPAEALEAARQGMEILREKGKLEEGESLLRVAHAEALEAAGEPTAARQALREAHRRVVRLADAIEDTTWRASFLEGVPENARTVALFEEWLRR